MNKVFCLIIERSIRKFSESRHIHHIFEYILSKKLMIFWPSHGITWQVPGSFQLHLSRQTRIKTVFMRLDID